MDMLASHSRILADRCGSCHGRPLEGHYQLLPDHATEETLFFCFSVEQITLKFANRSPLLTVVVSTIMNILGFELRSPGFKLRFCRSPTLPATNYELTISNPTFRTCSLSSGGVKPRTAIGSSSCSQERN